MGWMVVWNRGDEVSCDWDIASSDYTRDGGGSQGVLIRLDSESGVGTLRRMMKDPDGGYEYRVPRTILDFLNERLSLTVDERVFAEDVDELERRFGGPDEYYLMALNQIRNVILDHPEREEFVFGDTYM